MDSSKRARTYGTDSEEPPLKRHALIIREMKVMSAAIIAQFDILDAKASRINEELKAIEAQTNAQTAHLKELEARLELMEERNRLMFESVETQLAQDTVRMERISAALAFRNTEDGPGPRLEWGG